MNEWVFKRAVIILFFLSGIFIPPSYLFAEKYNSEKLKFSIDYDENWKFIEEDFSGIAARIIQHEYDHIEGILFTDHLNPLKRRLLKRKLVDISKGRVDVDYKMKFAKK